LRDTERQSLHGGRSKEAAMQRQPRNARSGAYAIETVARACRISDSAFAEFSGMGIRLNGKLETNLPAAVDGLIAVL